MKPWRVARLTVATLLCLMGAVPAIAEGRDFYRTKGMLNGHEWLAMDHASRLYFVAAFNEGIRVTPESNRISREQYECVGCTYDDIVDGITAFYRDPAYRSLPIIVSWRIHVMRAKGIAKETIEAEISEMLRYISH